jgi:pyruvate dehydrogenase E2 component (dihydrolipoamide acetyltransferase)
MTDTTDIKVPDLGDFSDVEIIEVLVKSGDPVAKEDGLITLETDKAALDVPADRDGVIEEISVKVGDRVSSGDVIGRMKAGGEDAAGAADDGPAKDGEERQKKDDSKGESKVDKPDGEPDGEPDDDQERNKEEATAKPKDEKSGGRRESAARRQPSSAPATTNAIDEAGFARAHASPSVRKLARELGVDLIRVRGSGPKNRIVHDDVKAFVKSVLTGDGAAGGAMALPKVPSIDFSKFGEVKVEPLTRIQKISGPRLQASWINVPHVTQHDLADVTELEKKRQELKAAAKERAISLTPLAFIMRACVATLKEFPKANASLSDDGESLVFKQYCHLGFAADTENGLMVPVIRDADKKDVYELAKELGELSQAARDGKLKAAQLQGAGFTISSLGGIGGTAFTPIVNAPEVAILGVSRSSMQPVWDGERFQPRLMLPLSLSYDHRVIDGAYAVRFTTFLAKALSDVDALLEAIP